MANIAKMSDSPALTTEQVKEFAARLEKYRHGVEKKYAQHWAESKFTHNPGGYAIVVDGTRFVKVKILERRWLDQMDHSKGEVNRDALVDSRIHSFIDKLTGDVLKPESWKKPAKHARGNIYDESNGLARVNHFGPEYIR
jgi:hypothetical protein